MHILKFVYLAGLLVFCSGQISQPCGYNRKGKTTILIGKDDPADKLKKLSVPQQPHSLRIQARYMKSVYGTMQFSAVRSVFSVARYFYSKLLKVTYLPQHRTRFPVIVANRTNCENAMEESFLLVGIDQNKADMIVFVDSIYSQEDQFVGYGQCCFLDRRPLFGYMLYNFAYVAFDVPHKMHLAIQITIHELTHILGFAEELFGEYYETPMGNKKRSITEVRRDFGSRSMIISPKVKEYVQNHFKCSDGVTGALLENDRGVGTANSHWESAVYRDQLMTPMYLESGSRITALTIALLQDTNYYQEVDTSMSEPTLWGAGKGCNFAIEEISQFPPFCDRNDTCDFYSQFMVSCKSNGYSPVNVENIKAGGLCQVESKVSATQNNVYSNPGGFSRCFVVTGQKQVAACYPSVCAGPNGPISVTVKGVTGICRFPNQQLSVAGVKLMCPRDLKVFCLHKECKNWCSGHGLCLSGVCLCSPRWTDTDCSKKK